MFSPALTAKVFSLILLAHVPWVGSRVPPIMPDLTGCWSAETCSSPSGCTITSEDRQPIVPSGNPGNIVLSFVNAHTCSYSKNDNVSFTTFTNPTTITIANGDKLKFRVINVDCGMDNEFITLTDAATNTFICRISFQNNGTCPP